VQKEIAMKSPRSPLRPVWLALLLALASLCFVPLIARAPFFAAAAPQVTAQIAVVNAASFASDGVLAREAIASAFGNFQTQHNQAYLAATLPLPTNLGGVTVRVNNLEAGLFFTSATQINFIVPGATTLGTANVTITNADGTTRVGTMLVVEAAPGIFTARANGQGVAAAQTTFDGVNYHNVANPDGSARNVDPGTPQRPNFLILYATGLRHAPAANPNDGNGVAEAVTVTVQGVPARVDYAGPQSAFAGLDQLNVRIPPQLAGLGSVIIRLTVNGRAANPVTIKLAGELPLITTLPISAGQILAGALTTDDQVQDAGDGSGDSFFFDAYRFSGAANTSVAFDLRSTQFDAALLLYQVGGDGSLSLIASDDQLGGLGEGQGENNNALLLAVLPANADYVILASSANVDPNGMGSYTISFNTNVIQPITYGANLTGSAITPADIQSSAGDYLDAYWFFGTQGDNAQIRMTSTVFDPFLILNLNSGDLIAADDNTGGGPFGVDAQITQALPQTGVYIIIATPYSPLRTGGYTLRLTRTTGVQAADTLAATPPAAPGRTWPDARQQQRRGFERFALRRVAGREQ
jgi:uncharacterized protein (TIGR03437 family)